MRVLSCWLSIGKHTKISLKLNNKFLAFDVKVLRWEKAAPMTFCLCLKCHQKNPTAFDRFGTEVCLDNQYHFRKTFAQPNVSGQEQRNTHTAKHDCLQDRDNSWPPLLNEASFVGAKRRRHLSKVQVQRDYLGWCTAGIFCFFPCRGLLYSSVLKGGIGKHHGMCSSAKRQKKEKNLWRYIILLCHRWDSKPAPISHENPLSRVRFSCQWA